MLVLDASAALSGLLNAGPARELSAAEQLHAPHLVDSEVASSLRRHASAGRIAADDGWGSARCLERIWELGDNLCACDAGYVALALTSASSLSVSSKVT